MHHSNLCLLYVACAHVCVSSCKAPVIGFRVCPKSVWPYLNEIICKDPISKSGHILRFRWTWILRGHYTTETVLQFEDTLLKESKCPWRYRLKVYFPITIIESPQNNCHWVRNSLVVTLGTELYVSNSNVNNSWKVT